MPIVIPLLAIAGAYAALKGQQDEPEESGDATSDDTEVPTPSEPDPNTGSEPVTGINWSTLIEEMRGSVPSDYLHRWIYGVPGSGFNGESGGNPCSKGVWGGPWEAGIGQVYFDRDQRNTPQFGVTLDQLRSCCVVDSQSVARTPTGEEMRYQVSSLVAMATKYISLAGSRNTGWDGEGILCLAKLYHALPVLVTTHLTAAIQDGQAGSWDEYRAYLGSMTRDEVLAIDQRMGYAAGHGAAPYWPLDRLFSNAQLTGRGR